jgi:hypothetical protein
MTVLNMCMDGQHADCLEKRKKVELGTVLKDWEKCECWCHTPWGKKKVAMEKKRGKGKTAE